MTTMATIAALPTLIGFRLAVQEVTLRENVEIVSMTVAHSNDPNDPNKSYSQFTPTASFGFSVTNPAIFGFFKPGVVYDLAAIPSDSGLTLVAEGANLDSVLLPSEPVAPTEPAPAPASEMGGADDGATTADATTGTDAPVTAGDDPADIGTAPPAADASAIDAGAGDPAPTAPEGEQNNQA